MADYKVQLKDELGNRQFPVTTTQCVVNTEGKTIDEILNSVDAGGFIPLSRDFSDDFNNDFTI